jgi:diaminohydroxyphosphoribosylaminopyrimidine deaminase/5-amino-6-(5-phosphoribosylamino)uracil reductase
MVGALLVRAGQVIGRGWHRRAGEPHAEIDALRDARRRGHDPAGSVLYVTLEPCSTQGRTPPCTQALIAAGIRKVVVGATDPNPRHSGRAFALLAQAGVVTVRDVLAQQCADLNAAFNHWIVQRTPWVTVKAAMTLDGKIAAPSGESKWITGDQARGFGMKLRCGADAILVCIHTILADDPSLTVRKAGSRLATRHRLRRIVLDALARTPLGAKVVSDPDAALTTVVVSQHAPARRVTALERRVRVLFAPVVSRAPDAPASRPRLDLPWLMRQLGSEDVSSLLVEGGGEVNASFLLGRLAHRVAFFYAPKILGGRDSLRAVAGAGAGSMEEALMLADVRWRKLGPDWLLTAAVRR